MQNKSRIIFRSFWHQYFSKVDIIGSFQHPFQPQNLIFAGSKNTSEKQGTTSQEAILKSEKEMSYGCYHIDTTWSWFKSVSLNVWCWGVPGSEGLQLVVGQVQHSEVAMSTQQRDTLVCQVVIGHIEFLQTAEAVLWQAGRREVLQLIGWYIQVTQAMTKSKE